MADPNIPQIDLDKLVAQIFGKLPETIEHHVKVRIIFHYVTPHPVTGEDIPIKPEVKTG